MLEKKKIVFIVSFIFGFGLLIFKTYFLFFEAKLSDRESFLNLLILLIAQTILIVAVTLNFFAYIKNNKRCAVITLAFYSIAILAVSGIEIIALIPSIVFMFIGIKQLNNEMHSD